MYGRYVFCCVLYIKVVMLLKISLDFIPNSLPKLWREIPYIKYWPSDRLHMQVRMYSQDDAC
jgi:hypothetical protein